jgi:hypothetical protein
MTPGEALAIFNWFEYVRKNNPDMLTKYDYHTLRDHILIHMTPMVSDMITYGDENFK